MAKQQPKKRGPGAPKANIDWVTVKMLVSKHCKGTEVAAFLGIDERLLYDRCKTDFGLTFSEFSEVFKAKGKAILRVSQYDKAIDGDTRMQIFLGKNYLEQADVASVNHSGTMKTEQHVVDYSKLSDAALEEIIKAGEQKPNE